MSMKFKVGDKVRVRSDLVVGKEYYNDDSMFSDKFVEEMKEYLGRIVTIDYLCENIHYLLKEDSGSWNWTYEMLEPVIDIKLSAERFL